MLVLFETAAGYAIFRIADESKLESVENIAKEFENPTKTNKFVKLVAFEKFKDMNQAVKSLSDYFEGVMPKDLSKFIKKNIVSKGIQESLACYNKETAKLIQKAFDIKTVHNSEYLEVFRGIRSQLTNLISGLTETDLKNVSVGLSHNLYRYKLKFSTDKIDVMVIQAVGLLDDLDKELNNYAMRLREWYGWHFPECGKIVAENVVYAKIVHKIGMRTNRDVDLSEFVDSDTIKQIKDAAEISMGSEISEEDEINIRELCIQIIALSEYRASLTEYLRIRMMSIGPNLTMMVGELVAARLISHAGSLINLAKQPASTIQIFGAEKALFRALRTKHDTPKYGLIYHASLVGLASSKLKGKISRSLAAKCALCIRVDALGENSDGKIGENTKTALEARIRQLEKGVPFTSKGPGMGKRIEKYNSNDNVKGVYNTENDLAIEAPQETKLLTKKKKKPVEIEQVLEEVEEVVEEEAPKKKKKKKTSV